MAFSKAPSRRCASAASGRANGQIAVPLSARDELRATLPAAAAQLGVTIIRMPVRNAVEIGPAISAFAAEPDGGLLVGAANPAVIEVIGRLALHHHLRLMYGGQPTLHPRAF